MRISVIIATYNRKDVLRTALAAYQNQTFRDFEVIVSSDGASDGTDEMMEEMKDSTGYPLHYIRQEDIGFRKSLALNKAIRIASGEILVFADDDMIPPPRYLENYAKLFRDGESCFVYAKYIPVPLKDELFTPENIRNGKYMKRYTFSQRFHLFYWKIKYMMYLRRHNPRRPKLNGANFAVTAEAMRAINGFDSDFTGWGYEDDDMRRRLLASGTVPKEAVCSAWAFNLGCEAEGKTTAGRPELCERALFNRNLAHDTGRPARCVHGMTEAEEAEVVF